MKSVKVLQLTRKFGYNLSNNENIINIKRSQDLPTNIIKQNIKYKSKKNNQIQNKLITNSIFPIKYKLIPQIINTYPQILPQNLPQMRSKLFLKSMFGSHSFGISTQRR